MGVWSANTTQSTSKHRNVGGVGINVFRLAGEAAVVPLVQQ